MTQPAARSPAEETVSRWRAAVECRDADAAGQCLAADAVLISPLTDRFRFTGRAQVRELLGAALAVIEEIRVSEQLAGDGVAALVARARIGDLVMEEVQLLRLDGAGLITEVTVIGRPLPALTALMSALGPAMARARRRPGLARFLAAATAPLHAMVRFGDRRVVPLAAPHTAGPG